MKIITVLQVQYALEYQNNHIYVLLGQLWIWKSGRDIGRIRNKN